MSEYYHIETGYKRLLEGGYRPEYQLSIPQSQRHNRTKRLQNCLTSMDTLSEYILPVLPKQVHSLLPATEKKMRLIKSLPSTKSKPKPVAQKAVSIFLCPSTTPKPKRTDLALRQSLLLERIKAKQALAPIQSRNAEKAAWQRGEWVISSLFLYSSSSSCPDVEYLPRIPERRKLRFR